MPSSHAGGGQQRSRRRGGFGGAKGFLQGHERAGLQHRAPTALWSSIDCAGLVAGNPQGFDCSARICSNSSIAVSPVLSRQLVNAPVGGDFCVLGIGRAADGPAAGSTGCPVYRDTHGIRLTGQGKGPAPGRPICPVARCRLIGAVFALPASGLVQSRRPSDRKLGEVPTHSAHCCSCSTLIPHS